MALDQQRTQTSPTGTPGTGVSANLREAPFNRITSLVERVLPVPIATVSLIDGDQGTHESRERAAANRGLQHEAPREAFVVPDTRADPRFAMLPAIHGDPSIGSYAGVPLRGANGLYFGSLCAMDLRPRNFDLTQVEILKSFAALVVQELELRQIAQVDALTGSATRRSFLAALQSSLTGFHQNGRGGALILMDIDYFKNVNDTHGHPAGDQVLRVVCTALGRKLRSGDLLGRLGGEEFGILLQGVTMDVAWKAAERARQTIRQMRFFGKGEFAVTASFGVAALDCDLESVNRWLALADEALYTAKRSGRDRVCIQQGWPWIACA